MKRQFDAEAVRAQIANLIDDRMRIDQAIGALEAALRAIEGTGQRELNISVNTSDVTLFDAVRAACAKLKDAITRQRVIAAIEREHPFLKPKSASVAAAMINLTKGNTPMLKLAIPGKGASPAYYSTEGDITIRLSADEIAVLNDEIATKGTGGWQSLWLALIKQFDKAKGEITLTPTLRARLHQYYHKYGEGGWQTKAQRVFRRELPHLFAT